MMSDDKLAPLELTPMRRHPFKDRELPHVAYPCSVGDLDDLGHCLGHPRLLEEPIVGHAVLSHFASNRFSRNRHGSNLE
jgi:hypothetical protein